ncbi:MAG TPA: RcnB family protein [Thermohalobaculum sp.]|nr:RcnB family protein [Thermohalobaculum sp.]
MKPGPILGGVLLVSIAALCVTAAEPAFAQGKSKGKHGQAPGLAVGQHCPPGLAKKGSCIPPGHRKHWSVGEYFPREIVYRRVYYYEYDLPRPRRGEFYAKVDDDVYLIAEATRLVVKAILSGSN